MSNEIKGEEFLRTMLNGYTQNMMQLDEYLANTEGQLEQAKEQKADMLEKIAELEEILGVEEEEEE